MADRIGELGLALDASRDHTRGDREDGQGG